ncbi:MAG: GAF domain-containing protein [Chloroflexi bacterium]|nr:GAF domain-containing protein [Chloroflexota bacterium]
MPKTLRLILIDDNPDDRLLSIRSLSEAFDKIEIIQITNANDLSAVIDQGEFDAVITDYQLRWTTGLDVLRAFKANHPDTPVIMFTATGNEAVAVEAMKAGLDDYILKTSKQFQRLPLALKAVLKTKEEHRQARVAGQRYQRLFEHVPIGLYRSTPDGRLLDLNPAGKRILGIDERDSLEGVHVEELYANPEDRERFRALSERLGKVENFEVQLRRRDGELIWARISARVVRDAEGAPIIYEGALMDITESKNAQERLRRYTAQTEALHEIIAASVQVTNLRMLLTMALKRTLEALNIEMGGFWLEQERVLAGLDDAFAEEMIHAARTMPEDMPMPVVVDDWHAPVKWPWSLLAPIMKRWGVRASLALPIMAQERLIGGMSLHATQPRQWTREEISLVKTVGRELGAAVERLRLFQQAQERAERAFSLASLAEMLNRPHTVAEVVEAIGQAALALSEAQRAAVYVRQADKTVTCAWRQGISESYATEAISHMTMMPSSSLLGHSEPILVPDIESWEGSDFFYKLAQSEGYRAVSLWPLVYEGRVVAVVGCYYNEPHNWTDIDRETMQTFSRQAAVALRNAQLVEELAHANEELRQALQAREDMLRNVTHELRTPLTLVQSYADLMNEGLFKTPEQVQEATRAILRQTKELQRLINQILAFQSVRQRDLEMSPFVMGDWLRNVVADWKPLMREENIVLREKIELGEEMVQGHKGYLRQVLNNLLENAQKFSPEGGEVTVQARRVEDDVMVLVSDEGIGVAADKLEKIFDQFYQVDASTTRRFKGMGIGLSLAKEIVEKHRGHIWAKSEGEGKGTTIIFTLPILDSEG